MDTRRKRTQKKLQRKRQKKNFPDFLLASCCFSSFVRVKKRCLRLSIFVMKTKMHNGGRNRRHMQKKGLYWSRKRCHPVWGEHRRSRGGRDSAQAQGLVQSKLSTLDATSESSNQQARTSFHRKVLAWRLSESTGPGKTRSKFQTGQAVPGTNIQRAHGEVRTQMRVPSKQTKSAMKQPSEQISQGMTGKTTPYRKGGRERPHWLKRKITSTSRKIKGSGGNSINNKQKPAAMVAFPSFCLFFLGLLPHCFRTCIDMQLPTSVEMECSAKQWAFSTKSGLTCVFLFSFSSLTDNMAKPKPSAFNRAISDIFHWWSKLKSPFLSHGNASAFNHATRDARIKLAGL